MSDLITFLNSMLSHFRLIYLYKIQKDVIYGFPAATYSPMPSPA